MQTLKVICGYAWFAAGLTLILGGNQEAQYIATFIAIIYASIILV